MNTTDASRVHFIEISADDAGQRVDNYIRKRYPGLPKSRIYQMLRKGEARLNKKRIKPTSRIAEGDLLRLPPIQDAEREAVGVPIFWQQRIADAVIYEDENFLILNKPAGISVHAGSKFNYGVIDAVKSIWGANFAELAHRIDRETTGVLVLGKNRQALLGFQQLVKSDAVEKRYWALVDGAWPQEVTELTLHLEKIEVSGEHRVIESPQGKLAHTYFHIVRELDGATLIEALLDTGRTHQIRVSTAHLHHAIAGDMKYGNDGFNALVKGKGFHGMFLHAKEISFTYDGQKITAKAPLPEDCEALLAAW